MIPPGSGCKASGARDRFPPPAHATPRLAAARPSRYGRALFPRSWRTARRCSFATPSTPTLRPHLGARTRLLVKFAPSSWPPRGEGGKQRDAGELRLLWVKLCSHDRALPDHRRKHAPIVSGGEYALLRQCSGVITVDVIEELSPVTERGGQHRVFTPGLSQIHLGRHD